MNQGKDNARLKSYKNKSLNTDEMRRRREEEGLQLRKQKKDEQVSKVQTEDLGPHFTYLSLFHVSVVSVR